MQPNLDPNDAVNIPCPTCGEKTPQTVGDLMHTPRLRCKKCGVQFTVDAKKILQRVKEAQAGMTEQQRRFGR